jgi:uncharacterized protein YebE (UPF0316 family)
MNKRVDHMYIVNYCVFSLYSITEITKVFLLKKKQYRYIAAASVLCVLVYI